MDEDDKIPISRESRAGIYLSQSQLTKHNTTSDKNVFTGASKHLRAAQFAEHNIETRSTCSVDFLSITFPILIALPWFRCEGRLVMSLCRLNGLSQADLCLKPLIYKMLDQLGTARFISTIISTSL